MKIDYDRILPRERSYPALRQLAERWHNAHNGQNLLPAPLELMIGYKQNYDIVPVDDLLRDLEVFGCLAAMDRTIFIDSSVYNGSAPERCQTLAHEFAHSVLHYEFLTTNWVKTVNEWIEFYVNFPVAHHYRLEFEAATLANLLLVHPPALVQRLETNGVSFSTPGKRLRDLSESSRLQLVAQLAIDFDVLPNTIEFVLSRENLWGEDSTSLPAVKIPAGNRPTTVPSGTVHGVADQRKDVNKR